MKKYTALLSTILILLMLALAGCSSSNSDATSTAKPTPDISTIGPTATVDTTLTNDTKFDGKDFSITIPKNAVFKKTEKNYAWWTYSEKYGVNFSLNTANQEIDLNFIQKNTDAMTNALSLAFDGKIKIDSEYSKVTICGKNAILYTGKGIGDWNADLNFYFVESNNGILDLMIIKKYEDNDPQTIKDAKTAADNILSTLTIK